MTDNAREEPLLTIAELSARTRISATTLRRWVRQGRIPCHQPGGRGGKLYFPPDAIQRARSQHTTSEASATSPQPISGRRPAWMHRRVD